MNKRKLSRDKDIVNSIIVPSNSAKKRRLNPKLLDGTSTVTKGYFLAPKRIIVQLVQLLRKISCRYVMEIIL